MRLRMKKQIKHDAPKRILIIRLSAMGDVLLTTPLVRLIKRQFPQATIDFLVKDRFVSLLRSNPYIHQVLCFYPDKGFTEIRRIVHHIRLSGYDTVLDLQVNLRSLIFRRFSKAMYKIHFHPERWRRFLLVHLRINRYTNNRPVPLRYLNTVSKWGISDDGGGLDLKIDSSADESVQMLLKKEMGNLKAGLITMAPGAGRKTKRWSASRFAEAGDYFMKQGKCVCLVGGEGDQEVCDSVVRQMRHPVLNFANRFSIQETAALVLHSELLISNDTGVMHIGCALGKPVVALFGPTTGHLGFTPFRSPYRVVEEEDLDCRPCSYHGTENCPKRHFLCMEAIPVSRVIKAAEELLSQDKP